MRKWLVLLPAAAVVILAAIYLWPSPPTVGRQTVLFLGDSLTAGYGLQPNQAYPAMIEEKIRERGLDAEVINAGISGDTTAGGLGRLPKFLERRVDVLVLALGANDGMTGVPIKQIERNLQAIIDRCRSQYPQMKILVAGMKIPPSVGLGYMAQFVDLFPRLAKKNKVTLIPFVLEGVAAHPSLNLDDGIHPNVEGQRRVAENVWRYLEPIL